MRFRIRMFLILLTFLAIKKAHAEDEIVVEQLYSETQSLDVRLDPSGELRTLVDGWVVEIHGSIAMDESLINYTLDSPNATIQMLPRSNEFILYFKTTRRIETVAIEAISPNGTYFTNLYRIEIKKIKPELSFAFKLVGSRIHYKEQNIISVSSTVVGIEQDIHIPLGEVFESENRGTLLFWNAIKDARMSGLYSFHFNSFLKFNSVLGKKYYLGFGPILSMDYTKNYAHDLGYNPFFYPGAKLSFTKFLRNRKKGIRAELAYSPIGAAAQTDANQFNSELTLFSLPFLVAAEYRNLRYYTNPDVAVDLSLITLKFGLQW